MTDQEAIQQISLQLDKYINTAQPNNTNDTRAAMGAISLLRDIRNTVMNADSGNTTLGELTDAPLVSCVQLTSFVG